jgi:hypothetical protein
VVLYVVVVLLFVEVEVYSAILKVSAVDAVLAGVDVVKA